MPKRLPRPDRHNHLLATLPPHLTEVALDLGMVLEEPGQPIGQVVFPLSGVMSIIVSGARTERRIEAGLFGCDGMTGTAILLGSSSTPNELLVQVPGHGLRIGSERLRDLMDQGPGLQRHLLMFVQALLIQTTQTALSNKNASLEERLARWLLMCHDRAEGDRLVLTHEFMSAMLGVRRAGVTVGTQILEGKGLIRAKRGEIIILDREGLEEEAGGSYGVAEAEYIRLFGSRRNGP